MTDATAPTAGSGSRWEDFADVFIAPVQLFRRRIDGKFGHGLLLLVLLTAALYFGTKSAMQPIMDAEFAKQTAAMMKRNPAYTQEQADSFRSMGEKFAVVGLVIALPIAVFLLGAVIWLGARVVGGGMSFAQAATISTFAFFPRLVEAIVKAVQALLMDEGQLTSQFKLSLGLARILDPGQVGPFLFSLLGRIDLFTLWVTALIAIGIKQIAKVTTGKAVAAAAIIWVVGLVPVWIQTLRAG
jgi:hypothetical protein